MTSENRGLSALEDRVIRKDLCTLCGACAALCPYLHSHQGRIVKLHDCDLEEGRCFAYCPRTKVDINVIHREIFGKDYQDLELGTLRHALMARAMDPEIRQKAQSGGVVSALTDFALKIGMIDAAVITHRDEHLLPSGIIARDRTDILASAGSSYVAGPTLEALNRGPWQGTERIAVVGLPCQVLALGKMRASPLKKRTPIDQIQLIIGLFCTWALRYKPFARFIRERVKGAPIHNLDITPPPERHLKVTTDEETLHIPLDEIRRFIRPTCGICPDMTSEFSDVSVGTVEGIEGWNTVVVRTDQGETLLKEAEGAGIVEIRPLPEANLEHLKEASLLKKQRAISALKQRGELEDGYLVLPPEWIQRILSDSPEVCARA